MSFGAELDLRPRYFANTLKWGKVRQSVETMQIVAIEIDRRGALV